MSDERFVQTVSDLTPLVLRVAAVFVGMADAEDAAQEAILRAWRAWPTLRDGGAVQPWLLQITVNVCRQWQRGRFGTRQRLSVALPDGGAIFPGALLDVGPGTGAHAEELDLRAALLELSDDLRLVVALRYFGGMDATVIGAALNLPPATVRTRLRRALTLLRERLRESGDRPAIPPTGGNAHA